MIELRILGVALAGLWLAAFVLVLIGYRPGGPADAFVALALAGPIAVALAGVLWPPVARGDRAFAAITWLGLGAVLMLLPSLVGVATQIAGGGPQTLLPSAEAAYPWVLALLATGLFAGLGIARRRLGETALRRRRLVLGTAIGIVLVLVTGTAFTLAAVANELALGDQPAISSRFGPTDATTDLPECGDPLSAGATARVELRMDASVDDRRTGQVAIGGVRDGADVRWTGFAATRATLGQHGVVHIGDRAWIRQPHIAWTSVPPWAAAGEDLDRQLVEVALTPENRTAAEDRGVAFIEGARARHCRITIDGETLRLALPEVDLLIGGTDVSRWRGDLDYWVFVNGELGQADGQVSGPATGLAEDALIATLRFRMTAVDRGRPVSIRPP
jgi:hypothetical protein